MCAVAGDPGTITIATRSPSARSAPSTITRGRIRNGFAARDLRRGRLGNGVIDGWGGCACASRNEDFVLRGRIRNGFAARDLRRGRLGNGVIDGWGGCACASRIYAWRRSCQLLCAKSNRNMHRNRLRRDAIVVKPVIPNYIYLAMKNCGADYRHLSLADARVNAPRARNCMRTILLSLFVASTTTLARDYGQYEDVSPLSENGSVVCARRRVHFAVMRRTVVARKRTCRTITGRHAPPTGGGSTSRPAV